jgi:hypothetical protein
MSAFAGELGFFEHHYRNEEYLPGLPILDTEELFDHIPKEGAWKLPKPFRQFDTADTFSYQKHWDKLLNDWIHYFNRASKGFHLIQRTVSEGIVTGDLESIQAARYFRRGGLEATFNDENIANISSVRRAFIALLSKDAQQKLKVDESEMIASEDDIQNARTLVNNFERHMPFFDLPLNDYD